MPLVLAGVLGCGDDPAPETLPPSATVEPLDPSPWTYETTGATEPPVDLDAVGQALDLAIVGILAYDAAPVVDGYLGFWNGSADAGCPAATPDPYGNFFWVDACTAADGTYFGGYLTHNTLVDVFEPETGVYLDGVELYGNISVSGPDGTYDLEGTAVVYDGTSPDGVVRLVQSTLVGGFAHDGAAATGWLRDAGLAGRAVEVTLIGISAGGVASATIVDGAVGVDSDGDWNVVFELNGVADEALGTLCADEPGGTISIRDPHGRWFDVSFHGPDLIYGTTLGDPARCDGCGEATLDGEPVGEVCGDFDPWYAWEALR